MSKTAYAFPEFEKLDHEQWSAKLTQDIGVQLATDILSYPVERGLKASAYHSKDQIMDKNKFETFNGKKNTDNKWIYFQKISEHENSIIANENVRSGLNNGAGGLILHGAIDLPIVEVLKDVMPQYCYISFINVQNLQYIESYLDWIRHLDIDKNAVMGFVCYAMNPIEHNLKNELDVYLNAYHQFTEYQQLKFIDIQPISISSLGGGVQTQCLFICSRLVYLINELAKNEISFEDTLNRLCIYIDVGSDYFLEIAKIRAIRWLTRAILDQYEAANQIFDIPVYAKVSPNRGGAPNDESNYLRCTTQAMSAILGGIDYLSIDTKIDVSSSIRIERNISNLLGEEAFLSNVIDPSAGSYFLEHLTSEIISNVWNQFSSLESKGGYAWATASGYFESACEADKNFMQEKK